MRSHDSKEDFDYAVNILLIGDEGVGKTSLLAAILGRAFPQDRAPTLAFDLHIHFIQKNNRKIKMYLRDTCGHPRWQSINKSHYRDIVLVLCDLTNEYSFENLSNHISHLRAHSTGLTQIILVGAKADLRDKRKIPEEQFKMYAKQLNCSSFETSAKDNYNIDKVFEHALRYANEKNCQKPINPQISPLRKLINFCRKNWDKMVVVAIVIAVAVTVGIFAGIFPLLLTAAAIIGSVALGGVVGIMAAKWHEKNEEKSVKTTHTAYGNDTLKILKKILKKVNPFFSPPKIEYHPNLGKNKQSSILNNDKTRQIEVGCVNTIRIGGTVEPTLKHFTFK